MAENQSPGIDITVSRKLPDETHIMMRTAVFADEPKDVVDGLLDRLSDHCARQAAKVSLEFFEEDLRKGSVALGTMIEALPIAAKNFHASLEALKVEAEEQSKAAAEIRMRAEEAWRNSGRGGEVELQGKSALNMKVIAKANKETMAKAEKVQNEHLAEMSQTLQNIKRAREDVKKQWERVNDARRMAGKEALVDHNIQSWLTCPLPEIGD